MQNNKTKPSRVFSDSQNEKRIYILPDYKYGYLHKYLEIEWNVNINIIL